MVEKCDRCGAVLTADHVCPACGLVSGEPVMVLEAPRPEYLDETNRETSTVRADRFASHDLLRYDFNLGSTFDAPKTGDEERDWLFARMKVLNEQESDWRRKSLRAAMRSIDLLGEWLDLPRPVERRVAYLYRKARKKGVTGWRDVRAILGVLTLIASREVGAPRTEDEILDAVNGLSALGTQLEPALERKDSGLTARELRSVKNEIQEAIDLDVPVPKPEQYIPRLAGKLGLSAERMVRSCRVCGLIDTGKLSGNPKLAAAAVLYSEAREVTTVREVANKFSMDYGRLHRKAKKVTELLAEIAPELFIINDLDEMPKWNFKPKWGSKDKNLIKILSGTSGRPEEIERLRKFLRKKNW